MRASISAVIGAISLCFYCLVVSNLMNNTLTHSHVHAHTSGNPVSGVEAAAARIQALLDLERRGGLRCRRAKCSFSRSFRDSTGVFEERLPASKSRLGAHGAQVGNSPTPPPHVLPPLVDPPSAPPATCQLRGAESYGNATKTNNITVRKIAS